MGTKTALKIESFAFFDNSRFMTTEQGLREGGTSYPSPGLGGPGLKGPGRVQVYALSFGIAP